MHVVATLSLKDSNHSGNWRNRTGKTLLVSKVCGECFTTQERVDRFAFGRNRAQPCAIATSWGIQLSRWRRDACSDHLCLPRIHGTRRPSFKIIKTEISDSANQE